MAEVVNTFTKGLDMDITPIHYDNEHYYYAENFRLIVDDELSSLTLTNGKGLSLQFATYNSSSISSSMKIVGACEIDDYLLLFVTPGRIYKIPLPISGITTPYDLVTDSSTYLIVNKSDFAFGDRIKCIPRIEKTNIRKVYWVDGTNPIRYINLDDTDIATKTVEEFSLFRRCLLGTPLLDSIIGGVLPAGVYKYAYCLYNEGGAETFYSDLSQPVPIVSDDFVSSPVNKTGWGFNGNDSGDETSKGVRVSITKNTTLSSNQELFDSIRVVRLYYSSQTSIPEITIVYEGANEDTVYIDDTGTINLGMLVYEEFASTNNYIIPKTFETKNDYLFLGNITENYLDITYDTRAYRFSSSRDGIEARLYNASTLALECIIYGASPNYTLALDTYDCMNKYNIVGDDDYTGRSGGARTSADDCKYRTDGTTLGGDGPNVSYEFTVSTSAFATTTTYGMLPTEYALIGYQRDEVYRFGVELFNKYGEKTFVKWIGDIRMPSILEVPIISNGYVQFLGIKFTFSNLPAEVTGYRIVRVLRSIQDQTVVDTGYVGHPSTYSSNTLYMGNPGNTYTNTDAANYHRPKLHPAYASGLDILEYICGETNYNKNNTANYSRVDIFRGDSSTSYLRTNPAPLATPEAGDNAALTYLYPHQTSCTSIKTVKTTATYSHVATRDDTYLVNLPTTFGTAIKLSPVSVSGDGNRGLLGSFLLLKLSSSINGGENYPGYAVRRNHINPYGGYSKQAIDASSFIPCSPITDYTDNVLEVYGGDTFITWFEYNRILWYVDVEAEYSADKLAQVCRCLVESKINFTYTVNPRMTSYTNFTSTTNNLVDSDYYYLAMWETSGSQAFSGGTETFVQDFDLYTYNPTYSALHYGESNTTLPPNFNTSLGFPTRIYRSNKKINGESSDSWSKVLSSNYLDMDSKYGDITGLKVSDNYMYCFQPGGIAIIPIEEREVVSSTSTSLSIGTGGVMTRYDYISNNSGTSYESSIMNTRKGIYYLDDRNRKIALLSGKEPLFLSDTKGVMSYTSSKDFSKCTVLYNPRYSEVWFNVDDESIIYNEYLDMFTSTLETDFEEGIILGEGVFCYSNVTSGGYTRSNLLKLDVGNYGGYSSTSRYSSGASYIEPPSSTSTVKFVVNPRNGVKNRFDVVEVNNHSSSGATDHSSTVTFTGLTAKTLYQTHTTATFNSSSTRKFRTWRYNNLRGSSSDRLHDNFLKLEFTYDPSVFSGTSTNLKFTMNDIVTHFIPTFIR